VRIVAGLLAKDFENPEKNAVLDVLTDTLPADFQFVRFAVSSNHLGANGP
jgi:hypothetical protein